MNTESFSPSPSLTVTEANNSATTQVKMDTNPSYDCVKFDAAKQKDTRTPQVKTDINPSYDRVSFSTARQPVTSTNMNYCYSTVPSAMRRN